MEEGINQISPSIENSANMQKGNKKLIWVLIVAGVIVLLLITGFVVYSMVFKNEGSANKNNEIISQEEYLAQFGPDYNPPPIE